MTKYIAIKNDMYFVTNNYLKRQHMCNISRNEFNVIIAVSNVI